MIPIDIFVGEDAMSVARSPEILELTSGFIGLPNIELYTPERRLLYTTNSITPENEQLRKDILIYKEALCEILTYEPEIAKELLQHYLKQLISSVKKHPGYKNIIGIQTAEHCIALGDGSIVSDDIAPTGKVLTLGEIERILTSEV